MTETYISEHPMFDHGCPGQPDGASHMLALILTDTCTGCGATRPKEQVTTGGKIRAGYLSTVARESLAELVETIEGVLIMNGAVPISIINAVNEVREAVAGGR